MHTFAELMIEDDEAVVKSDVAVGQFQIVDGAAREFRFGEIFQVVAPVTKAPPSGNGRVNFVQQFIARHQRVEDVPRVAELEFGVSDPGSRVWVISQREPKERKVRNGLAVTKE